MNIVKQHLLSQLKNRVKGFTLIELLVVLAIVATLLTLVAPRYFSQLETSKEVVLKDNLRSTREVIDKFYGDIGRYPDSLDELVEKKYLRSLPFDPVTDWLRSSLFRFNPVVDGDRVIKDCICGWDCEVCMFECDRLGVFGPKPDLL